MTSSISASPRKCGICGRLKPANRFNSPADSTCKICRKLMKRKIIVNSRVSISKHVFFGGVEPVSCVTCGANYAWDEYNDNSFECMYCNNIRHTLETYRLENTRYDVVCTVCGETKDVSAFPYGSFICKTCIAKTNRYKRRV